MRRDDYLQLMTNNELIQRSLKPKEDAMMALLENNLRLSRIAKYDSDLGEDKDKMEHFIISKSIDFLENKGLSFEEAADTLKLLAVGIVFQDKLNS